MTEAPSAIRESLSTLRSKRVLITGGTGFLGQHVIERGRALGATMWNLSRTRGAANGVEYLEGNLQDADAIRRALDVAQPDVILHLGAAGVTYSTEDFSTMLAVNAGGIEHLLSILGKSGSAPAVVTTGTCYEYANSSERLTEAAPIAPSNPYSVTKAAAALVAGFHAAEIPITLLRLFNVYGPGERAPRLLPFLVERAQRGEPAEVTPCEQLRDFVFAPDAALAVWLAAARPPRAGALKTLNVGTGNGTSLRTFIERVAVRLRERGYQPDIRFGARPYRPGEAMYVVADPTQLQNTFNWVPSTTLDIGVPQAVDSLL